jgi:hypothetical protein
MNILRNVMNAEQKWTVAVAKPVKHIHAKEYMMVLVIMLKFHNL